MKKNNFNRKEVAKMQRRGFSLIEIIIVVTIMAILASVIAPRLFTRVGEAKVSAAQSGCKGIAQQLTLYLTDEGISSIDPDFDLETLLLPPDEGGGRNGPYLTKKTDLIDPWGEAYVLVVPGEVNYDFDIQSYGNDKQPGGEGENKDITQ